MERAAVPSMIREQRLNQWIEDYCSRYGMIFKMKYFLLYISLY